MAPASTRSNKGAGCGQRQGRRGRAHYARTRVLGWSAGRELKMEMKGKERKKRKKKKKKKRAKKNR